MLITCSNNRVLRKCNMPTHFECKKSHLLLSLQDSIGRIATTQCSGLKRAVRLAALESIEEETFSMNKKLLVLAVAGAVSAPGLALAQTSQTPTSIVPSPGVATSNGITLYGRLDETIMYNKYSANAAGTIPSFKKGDVYSPGNAMGIRGREDLGGGTAAWFQLEIGVWPSERLDTATTTGNNWGGRNSAIGFSSGI